MCSFVPDTPRLKPVVFTDNRISISITNSAAYDRQNSVGFHPSVSVTLRKRINSFLYVAFSKLTDFCNFRGLQDSKPLYLVSITGFNGLLSQFAQVWANKYTWTIQVYDLYSVQRCIPAYQCFAKEWEHVFTVLWKWIMSQHLWISRHVTCWNHNTALEIFLVLRERGKHSLFKLTDNTEGLETVQSLC